MNATDPARRYLEDVRAQLPMRRKEKQEVMTQLTLHVSEYIYSYPQAGYEALLNRFGAPEEVSSMYVDSLDAGELSNALSLRQRIWKLAVSTAAALVLLFALAAGYMMWRVHNAGEGFVVITIPREGQSVLDVDAPAPDLNEILAQA